MSAFRLLAVLTISRKAAARAQPPKIWEGSAIVAMCGVSRRAEGRAPGSDGVSVCIAHGVLEWRSVTASPKLRLVSMLYFQVVPC